MDTAAQLLNPHLVCNVDYTGSIKDLMWEDQNPLQTGWIKPLLYINGAQTPLFFEKVEVNIDNEKSPPAAKAVLSSQFNKVEVKVTFTLLDTNVICTWEITNSSEGLSQIDFFLDNQIDFTNNRLYDTALYVPQVNGIIHYFAGRCLAIGSPMQPTGFACNSPEDHNGVGALPDKDLKLNMNPVTTGKAVSCLHFQQKLAGGNTWQLEVFLSFGQSIDELSGRFNKIKTLNLSKGLANNGNGGSEVSSLLEQRSAILSELLNLEEPSKDMLQQLVNYSYYLTYNSFRTVGGSFAALDSSYLKQGGSDDYYYFWGRDSALSFMALSKLHAYLPNLSGDFKALVGNYFSYLDKAFGDLPYLKHRYRLDASASLGSSWYDLVSHPGGIYNLQLDQTALAVISVANFVLQFPQHTNLARPMLAKLPAIADFLIQQISEDYIHKPCYDLWENHWGKFSSTQAALISALNSIEKLHQHNQLVLNFDKSLLNKTVQGLKNSLDNHFYLGDQFIRGHIDSPEVEYTENTDNLSADVHWLWQLGVKNSADPKLAATIELAETKLKKPSGFQRYVNDHYLKASDTSEGNVWGLANLWFAQYYLATRKYDKARNIIDLILRHMEPSGILAEMNHPVNGFGRSLRPVIWNHAEVLNLLLYT